MKKEDSKNIWPEGFWQKERPTITMEEALKDVTPVDWIYYLEHWTEEDEKFITLYKPREEVIADLKEFYNK